MEITARPKLILFTPANRPHRILIPALALAYLLLFAILTSTLWQTQDTFVYLMSALPALWANHRLARR